MVKDITLEPDDPDLGIHRLIGVILLLTRHSVAIQIGSDDLLQLMVRRSLLKPQAQVVLQILVELVTWKRQIDRHSSSKQTLTWKNLVVSLLFTCTLTKSTVTKGRDISPVKMLQDTKRQGHVVIFLRQFKKTLDL